MLFLALFICLKASASPSLAWGDLSDPTIMNPYFQKRFASLPLKGSVAPGERFWSGDYWPLYRGNINYRWYAKVKIGRGLKSPSAEAAKKMSIPELAELAPTEKFDLWLGRYDYPLVRVVDQFADPRAREWEGICHGWAPASMNHKEPWPKLLTNPDGINVPFGTTDIKALLSYYYAAIYLAPDSRQMGERCYHRKTSGCDQDLNAGAFHIVLTNRIGVEGKSFIADLDRFEEVWNHPITSYETVILGERGPDSLSAAGTVRCVDLKTTVTTPDGGGMSWRPVLGTRLQEYESKTYQYRLDLDSEGRIIGGLWLSQDRPDFLWMVQRPRSFSGLLSRLGELLDD